MKYYLISGERSGDLHSGNLVKALKKNDSDAQIRAWGGEYVQNAGAELVVHYDELAIMGFWEVVKQFSKIKKYINWCKEDILRYKPDVVILVDYGGFNLRIAKFCKSKGIRVFYYISPKVWAWNQSRAYKIKASVDRMFCILPFEKDFYRKFDWEVDYVGNPVVDAVKEHTIDESFRDKYGLKNDMDIVALLPGSRKQELNKMLPIMAEVVEKNPEVQFAVAAIKNFNTDEYSAITRFENVKLIIEDTYNLLAHSKAAIVTSGTATLETALWNVPQVVAYKAGAVSYAIAKSMIKVEFISLVNLIAGKEVVKELIQKQMTSDNINENLQQLMSESPERKEMLSGYKEVQQILGETNASENCAKLMVQYLQDS